MSDLEKTLAERNEQHGSFTVHAPIEMHLRDFIDANCANLTPVQRCGLGMIMHKVARILTKGNNNPENWHDIAGYATRVERDINEQVGP